MTNIAPAPVLKWVGGKRQLLSAITPLLPEEFGTYYEPFIGGGALLFHLQPKTAVINDINPELINLYQVIKTDVDSLIATLHTHQNNADHYYSVRAWDRDKAFYASLSDVEKAARIIYLNKTCFNGLYRVNSAGEFNSPFGKYSNPNIVNADTLYAVNQYFNQADVLISCGSYLDALETAGSGDFVYLDPPYAPLSPTANFTAYAKDGFTHEDQIALREYCDLLSRRGVRFMMSNSATDLILEQYADYDITFVKAKRAINSKATKRGAVDEVIVKNY